MRIELRALARAYGDRQALGPVDLDIEAHESVALLGPSGCGKSTVIRILAVLEPASQGAACLDGKQIAGAARAVGLVFQEPRLMPWLNVRENIRLALPGLKRAEQDRRIAQALAAVGLSDHAGALSGGMAQRAAVARALAPGPQILLLDEHFSALDAFRRAGLQDHVASLWRDARFALVLVTHDIEEALVVGDRVLVMGGPPARIVADMRVDLPRPRDCTATTLQALRRRVADLVAPREPPMGGTTFKILKTRWALS